VPMNHVENHARVESGVSRIGRNPPEGGRHGDKADATEISSQRVLRCSL
jgi:hypothetical protein